MSSWEESISENCMSNNRSKQWNDLLTSFSAWRQVERDCKNGKMRKWDSSFYKQSLKLEEKKYFGSYKKQLLTFKV